MFIPGLRLLSDNDGGLMFPPGNSFDLRAAILVVLATVLKYKRLQETVIKSITRSFIMLDTMIENENNFTNISIPFLRSCSQH